MRRLKGRPDAKPFRIPLACFALFDMRVFTYFYMFMHDLTMLTRERQTLIENRLEQSGRVVAAELSAEFGVSEDTIRRDLRELAAAGICEKVYGGALLRGKPLPFGARLGEKRDIKRQLGEKIAALLPEGGVIFIDAGSTNLAVAEAIGPERRMSIFTNAPAIASTLSLTSNVEVIMTGGRVDRELGGAIDAGAMASLEGVYPDFFVIGACGIDTRRGILADNWDEHIFKRAVASRSGHIITAADSSKIGSQAPYQVAPFSPTTTLVFQSGLPARFSDDLSHTGARIICLEEANSSCA